MIRVPVEQGNTDLNEAEEQGMKRHHSESSRNPAELKAAHAAAVCSREQEGIFLA